ncbi:MAG: photosystem II reaction center protein Psb28 [Leptolyngbya sp. SIO4C1]|nr:photosystem II reaction center protein Psb28 [Leptolyngbya sp. SIO4C1]
MTPTIEFYEGIPETLSNVSLRRHRTTGVRSLVLIFEELASIEQFNSFRNRFAKALKLTDSEGVIEVQPSGIKFIFGGPEGDDLARVDCTIEIDRDDHWERLMRFMHRYADANEMAYGEPEDQ